MWYKVQPWDRLCSCQGIWFSWQLGPGRGNGIPFPQPSCPAVKWDVHVDSALINYRIRIPRYPQLVKFELYFWGLRKAVKLYIKKTIANNQFKLNMFKVLERKFKNGNAQITHDFEAELICVQINFESTLPSEQYSNLHPKNPLRKFEKFNRLATSKATRKVSELPWEIFQFNDSK